jgi:hypothetical protein
MQRTETIKYIRSNLRMFEEFHMPLTCISQRSVKPHISELLKDESTRECFRIKDMQK